MSVLANIIQLGLESIREAEREEESWTDMANHQLIDDFIAMRAITEDEARALFMTDLIALCESFGITQNILELIINSGLGITTLKDFRDMDVIHIKGLSSVQRRAVVDWAHAFTRCYQIKFLPFKTPFVFDNEFDRITEELKISSDDKMAILRSGICMRGMASMQEMDLFEACMNIHHAQRRAFVRWAHSVAQFMAGRAPSCSMVR